MTLSPKEKAQQLYNKFYGIPLYILTVKQCCHIAVDEIINQNVSNPIDYGASWTYWMQVKEEINKL